MARFYILLLLVLFSLQIQAQWRGFKNVATHSVPDKVHLFHTKDITGDQIPDLTIFYTAADLTFGILKGKGNGSFHSPYTLAKEDNYNLSDIVDFNRDGYPDMAISSYWNNGFKLFFGNATGTFVPGPFMATGIHGRSIKCVDINEDGLVDIIATTSGSGRQISLHVFIGKGDGTFHARKEYPSVLDTCKDIMIIDKNGDGRKDVLISSSFPWVLIYLQQADGSFVPHYYPTFTIAKVAIADVNRDGREDLILLYPSFENTPGSDSLVVRLNTGGDSFSASLKVTSFENRGIRPSKIRVADINKDGKADILLDHTSEEGEHERTLYYLLGEGDGTFLEPLPLYIPDRVLNFDVADVNVDGWVDIVISADNKTIQVLLNQKSAEENSNIPILVYPNPAIGRFYLKGISINGAQVQVYNSSGQLVAQQTIADMQSIAATGWQSGLYFIKVFQDKKTFTVPLFIK
jgi:hypothetical protein